MCNLHYIVRLFHKSFHKYVINKVLIFTLYSAVAAEHLSPRQVTYLDAFEDKEKICNFVVDRDNIIKKVNK